MDSDEVRVVVVDDVIDVADSVAALLELDGYNVVTANDGIQALSVIESHRPQCVLLDIKMPRADGGELSRRLRELYRDDVILIAFTGQDETNPVVADTFARVDHYLRKPVEPSELRRLLPPLRCSEV
jgi:CheY-like chemotaxis protein